MALRMPRFMTGRNIPADDARCLLVLPIVTGETLRSLYFTGHAVSRGTGFGGITGNPASFPDQPAEINWHCLYVPHRIASTYVNTTFLENTIQREPVDANEWDRLFRTLLFEWEADGNEYYGGDADADTVPVQGRPVGTEANPDSITTSETDREGEPQAAGTPGQSSSQGPLGIVRLFGREVFALPVASDGDGKARMGDYLGEQTIRAPVSGPGYLLMGVIRYETAAQTDFNWEGPFNTSGGRGLARRMLIGGDLTRAQRFIETDAGDTGDWMRTVLFGGDSYIEADTIKGLDMKAYIKGVATVETPYRLIRF